MKAEVKTRELEQVLALVSKGVQGKKARERAKALLVFGEDGISVEFNDLSANCTALVSESGKYALNPFIFRPFLKTFGKTSAVLQINKEGITIGRLRIAHIRVHGRFDKPAEAIESWEAFRNSQLRERQKRIEKDAEWKKASRLAHEDKLLDARYVAFKRTDGGVEYGAAVLKYEKGELGNRKVYVKTKDFQEVWISELEIVSYGKDPEFET